jgi:hypothetical protein
VLHGDINALLKHAIERHEEATKTGKKEAMEANQLPPKGAINFIYCGPPCQGFTGMNRFPKADDVLNSLIATTLSCVDFYRPTYFLLGASMDLLGRLIRGRGIFILIYDSVLSSRFTHVQRMCAAWSTSSWAACRRPRRACPAASSSA